MISMENVSIMVKIYKLFPEVSKMGKLFPNGLFGNNVKYSPLLTEMSQYSLERSCPDVYRLILVGGL